MNWWQRFDIWLEDFLLNFIPDPETDPKTLPMNQTDPIQPPIVIVPPTENRATLDNLCLSIRDYEGAPGDRNYRNNNPGNCRYSSIGYLPIYGHVGKDAKNFAIFNDMATGMLYLHNLIKEKVAKSTNHSIYHFMQSYAPVTDGNDPLKYAQFIATRLGVDINYSMNLIVAS